MAETPLFEVKQYRTFLAVLQGWCNGDKSCSILASTGVAKDTFRKSMQAIKNTVALTLEKAKESNQLMLGGPGIIVEVDECHLHKRKYGRGSPLAADALRVVGVIERDATGQRRSAFLLTRRRGADVLVPFIRENVAPGSIPISDEWKGYTRVLEQDYIRLTINHSVEYGHTIDFNGQQISVNTNHIEREWVEVRKLVKNIPEDRYNEKLAKEIFRLMYFNRCPVKERPFIFLQKKAQTMK